jgi:hypothetical protein
MRIEKRHTSRTRNAKLRTELFIIHAAKLTHESLIARKLREFLTWLRFRFAAVRVEVIIVSVEGELDFIFSEFEKMLNVLVFPYY